MVLIIQVVDRCFYLDCLMSHEYFQVFHTKFKICFQQLVLLERKFVIQCKNIGTKFFPLVTPTSGGFVLKH